MTTPMDSAIERAARVIAGLLDQRPMIDASAAQVCEIHANTIAQALSSAGLLKEGKEGFVLVPVPQLTLALIHAAEAGWSECEQGRGWDSEPGKQRLFDIASAILTTKAHTSTKLRKVKPMNCQISITCKAQLTIAVSLRNTPEGPKDCIIESIQIENFPQFGYANIPSRLNDALVDFLSTSIREEVAKL